jgi:hypothetical protein
MFKVISIELLAADVIISANQNDDQLYKHLSHRFTREQFNLAFDDWKSDARTITHNDGFVLIRFRGKIKKDSECLGLVAHEAYHASYSILDRIGIQPGCETEEVYAYLIQYLVKQIYKS